MKVRRTARLILLDQHDRLLLIKVEDRTVCDPEKPIAASFWVTPGGEVQGEETYEDAARRELWEETGLQQVDMGAWLWTQEHQLHWKGEVAQLHEHFFLARAKSTEVKLDNLTPEEQVVYRAHR